MTTDRRAELLAFIAMQVRKAMQEEFLHGSNWEGDPRKGRAHERTAYAAITAERILAALNEAPQAAQPGGVEDTWPSEERIARVIAEACSPDENPSRIWPAHLDEARAVLLLFKSIAPLSSPPKGNVPAFEDGALREAAQNAVFGLEYIVRELLHAGQSGPALAIEKASALLPALRAALSPDTHAQGAAK